MKQKARPRKKTEALILFGAGASYGSGGIKNPPPLGKNLFDELSKKFPNTWGSINQDLANSFRENFEMGMELLYNNEKQLASFLKDMAIYFCGFKIDILYENLYWQLIRRYTRALESGSLVLSTLNYDPLIELSALNSGRTIRYWGENKGIEILKLHGSCNFIKTGIRGSGNFIINKSVINGPIESKAPAEVEKRMNDSPLPPAMSLYTRSKEIIIAPEQIKKILREYKKHVMSAKLIVIVGVRPNPDDHHIWDPLIKTPAKLLLIGNEDGCKEWLSAYRQKREDKWISNRFKTGFDEMCWKLDFLLEVS